jgi:hypothetical protein
MRRGPRNLRITFDANALTHYGGVVLVHELLKRIGLRSQLAWAVWFRQRNNHYQISETVLAVLYPVFLGMERLGFTESLRYNGVFQVRTFPRRAMAHAAPQAPALERPKMSAFHAFLRLR